MKEPAVAFGEPVIFAENGLAELQSATGLMLGFMRMPMRVAMCMRMPVLMFMLMGMVVVVSLLMIMTVMMAMMIMRMIVFVRMMVIMLVFTVPTNAHGILPR